jgi:hypothetical protein
MCNKDRVKGKIQNELLNKEKKMEKYWESDREYSYNLKLKCLCIS